MGYKYNADDMLDAAVELAVQHGLSCLSYGRLAKEIGVVDRSIVYYFPTKHDLVARTVQAVGLRLQVVLGEALGDEPVPPPVAAKRLWSVMASPDADPVFAIFLEMVGLAATSVEPYDTLTPALLESWAGWLAPRLATVNVVAAEGAAVAAEGAAYAVLAKLDGLLLIRHTVGADAAESAAVHLGIS